MTTEPLTRRLALGVDDDKCIWALQVFNDDMCIWHCNIDSHHERCRKKPSHNDTQRCCCVPRYVACETANTSDSAVDLAKHSCSEHWCLGQSFVGLSRSQLGQFFSLRTIKQVCSVTHAPHGLELLNGRLHSTACTIAKHSTE